jgi:lipopolysaccharide heptosyltransferase I
VPVLVSLRRRYPGAVIDWMVQDTFAEAVSAHPALSGVVPFARGRMGAALRRGQIGLLRAWRRALSKAGYDLVIDAQGLLRSAIFARMTGAQHRVGYANAQEGAWLLYTHRVAMDRSLHAVDRMLGLVEAAGAPAVRDMRLYTSSAQRESAAELAPDVGVVLAPTSRWAAKRWPDDRFAALAERLLAMTDEPITVIGAAGEENQCRALMATAAREPRVRSLVGRTSIGQTLAVIERSRLVVANDSAALHMAVGFDRPLVALYGPTDVSRVGPYGRGADVLTRVTPADDLDHKVDAQVALMERLEVDEVAEACLARLAASGAAARAT